jgi:hypothetical protein
MHTVLSWWKILAPNRLLTLCRNASPIYIEQLISAVDLINIVVIFHGEWRARKNGKSYMTTIILLKDRHHTLLLIAHIVPFVFISTTVVVHKK